MKDCSDSLKEKIKQYQKEKLLFTKLKLLDWLCKRNNMTLEEIKIELLTLKNLRHTEKQEIEYKGEKEERFKCYFVYSNTRGRCYVLKFEENMKIITVFPIGRTTLRRYRRKFK